MVIVYALIGLAAILAAYALLGIVAELIRTSIDPNAGIHAFNESFNNSFEDPDKRAGR